MLWQLILQSTSLTIATGVSARIAELGFGRADGAPGAQVRVRAQRIANAPPAHGALNAADGLPNMAQRAPMTGCAQERCLAPWGR